MATIFGSYRVYGLKYKVTFSGADYSGHSVLHPDKALYNNTGAVFDDVAERPGFFT